MSIEIIEKGINDIELIKPLWEELNRIHYNKSMYFKEKYNSFTFEKRLESIYQKSEKGLIKLDLLWDSDIESYIGYCLYSLEGDLGEIESICIKAEYRKNGLGDKLMKKALDWFEERQITNVQIGVVYDNSEALPFYQSHGFYVSTYILRKK